MSLYNLSIAYSRMRRERDDAVGEYEFIKELVTGLLLDKSPGAFTFLKIIADEHREAELAEMEEQKAA